MRVSFSDNVAEFDGKIWKRVDIYKKILDEGGFYFEKKNWYTIDRIPWFMGKMRTKDIYYTQNSISKKFRCGTKLYNGIDAIRKKIWNPTLRVVILRGRGYSIDNRRLWCLKKSVRKLVKIEKFFPSPENQDFLMKRFTTNDRGESIFVRW